MKKTINSKLIGSMVVYTLLSLFLCMVGVGNTSAAELNPVVKIDNTSYTSSGTEVTLRLWMFNIPDVYSQYRARFTGDVNLYIDDQMVIKLNSLWASIANKTEKDFFRYLPTQNPVDIYIDDTNVGTAQFLNRQFGQTYPYNSNTTEKSWYTVDLKLSFNKSFSYYGHKITVKGKWQDISSGSVVNKDAVLDNDINGFVRPFNMSAQPSGDNMVFTWEKQGYNSSASTDGKWVVYKREGDNNVKQGEVAANEQSLSIEKKQYNCSEDYIMTFLPNVCEGEETVCGLTTTFTAPGHQINDDDICQMCGHSFFRYQTSDGNTVDIGGRDFGATVVSHEVVDGKCVIEFDAPITKIPANAFYLCGKLTGNLVIPNSVTEIGDYAFYNCTGFTGDLTIPNSVKTIGESAFYYCTGFTGDLTISNSVTTIGNSAFYKCSGFKGKLTISNSVKTIGESAFCKCSGFTGDLAIPNSVTTIGKSAFEECWGFKGKLTISNSVKTIGNSAFSYCSGFMGDLTIPNSVTTIGNSAFYKCSGFKGKLTISNSVKTIGYSAFSYCSGFTGDLLLPKSLEVVGYRSFEDRNYIQPINFQSLPTGIGNQNKYKTVSLSDDSYISDQATGTVDAISYTRTMTSNWGTLVLPYSLTLTGNEPYRLYAIDNMEGEELVLKQLEGEVAAGTPCVVKRNGTESELTFDANDATLNMAIETQNVGGMTFSGTYWTKDVNSGYVISKNSFWNVEELKNSSSVKGVKVRPFRAWLSGTSANAPACLSIRIDGSTTGINAAEALDALNDAEAEYYDLSGKRLDEPQKGVNIVRMKSGKTKKIIIK